MSVQTGASAPARHFTQGRGGPAFRTTWRIAAESAGLARATGIVFQAAVAEGAYSDLDDFRREPHAADVPFVTAVKHRRAAALCCYQQLAHLTP